MQIQNEETLRVYLNTYSIAKVSSLGHLSVRLIDKMQFDLHILRILIPLLDCQAIFYFFLSAGTLTIQRSG